MGVSILAVPDFPVRLQPAAQNMAIDCPFVDQHGNVLPVSLCEPDMRVRETYARESGAISGTL